MIKKIWSLKILLMTSGIRKISSSQKPHISRTLQSQFLSSVVFQDFEPILRNHAHDHASDLLDSVGNERHEEDDGASENQLIGETEEWSRLQFNRGDGDASTQLSNAAPKRSRQERPFFKKNPVQRLYKTFQWWQTHQHDFHIYMRHFTPPPHWCCLIVYAPWLTLLLALDNPLVPTSAYVMR